MTRPGIVLVRTTRQQPRARVGQSSRDQQISISCRKSEIEFLSGGRVDNTSDAITAMGPCENIGARADVRNCQSLSPTVGCAR